MEGINLISSTYSDDDDDDIEDRPDNRGTLNADADVAEEKEEEEEERPTNTTTIDENATQFVAPRSRPVTPQLSVQQKQLTIVDYGHDEVTMSPEAAQEQEVVTTSVVMIETQLQMTNGNENTLLSSSQVLSACTQTTTPIQDKLDGSGSQAMDFVMNEPESTEVEEPVKDSGGVTDDDLVARFLPSPPKAKCLDDQQEKIIKFLNLKRLGKSYNAEVRNKKEYRNPDFLRHAVTYQDIDEIGSCLRKEVFDPHGYDKSDFYDEIEVDMKRELERKEQERKKNQKVEFVTGGAQSGVIAPSPKINIPIPAVPTATASGLRQVSTAVDSTTRDGRNKKSKWDKVDGDQTTAGAHATLLTAASAGSGYTAFAQQRRRETEEKKYIEKRIDRRS